MSWEKLLKFRQYSVILIFCGLIVGISIYSLMGKFIESDSGGAPLVGSIEKIEDDESFFKIVDYYIVKNSLPFLKLESSELAFSKQNTVVISFNPVGVIHRHDDVGVEIDPIFFKSQNSRVLKANKELDLKNNVEIKMANSEISSDNVRILNNGREIRATGSVRTKSLDPKSNDQILITSERVTFLPAQELYDYQVNVKGVIERKRKYEDSVTFTTDNVTFSGLLSLVEMQGNVTFKKGNLDASSNRGSIFLENYNKSLKYYSLSDDVKLQESLLLGEKPIVRKAFAEKLEGLTSEKKIILTGLPKVFQGKDVIKGNRIIIRENIETVEVDDAITNITLEREEKTKE